MTDIVRTSDAPTLWEKPSRVGIDKVRTTVCSFLDTATTSLGRATHYESREKQQEAELKAHADMLRFDRDLYALFLALPGLTDRSGQLGLKNLLGTPRNGQSTLLTAEMEGLVLQNLVDALPPHRVLKIFDAFRYGDKDAGIRKANNARTRKLILRTILDDNRLERWAVTYRTKLRRCLIHAWGERKAGIIKAILEKSRRNRKETGILRENIDKYVCNSRLPVKDVYECVAFVLRSERGRWTLPKLEAYQAAKVSIDQGKKLTPEVLEGIRSVFHKDTPKEKVLQLTKDSMTKGQRMATQRRAKEAGVEVEMNPMDYDAVRLYLYGFEMGFSTEITDALMRKAKESAKSFPIKYGYIGILVDQSKSMEGDKTQPLRPIATALATANMLGFTAQASKIEWTNKGTDGLVSKPYGDTDLSTGLIRLLEYNVEAVYVISDGYENAPAGRFAEVVKAARDMGMEIPIYHINPVYASKSEKGVRELASGLVPTLPVQNPNAMGITILRGLLEADTVRGINALIGLSMPRLTKGGK